MRVEWRRLRAGELDHELVWLVVTVSAALAGSAWLALHLPWPICTFRALTGLPCVTCGATHASLSFLHGNLWAAFHFNPLVFVGICAVILFDLYALVVLSTGARRLRLSFPKARTRRVVLAAVVAAGLANWIYLLRQ